MRARLAMIMIWLLCLVAAVVGLVWMLVAIIPGSPRAIAIAIGFDQVGNATAGGDPDETISSRSWRYRAEQPYTVLRKLIDTAFALLGEPNHCMRAFIQEIARATSRIKP